MYNVESMDGLNKGIGYFKFKYSNNSIFYRGENKLHDSITPSICREQNVNIKHKITKLYESIKELSEDEKMKNNVSSSLEKDELKYVLEGLIQHYGSSTTCLDVVDNHWIALWFGNNKCEKTVNKLVCKYTTRNIDFKELILSSTPCWKYDIESMFQYILLIKGPDIDKNKSHSKGIIFDESMYSIDLRDCVGSYFLRPHAQHGVVLKSKCVNQEIQPYDEQAVAIFKIRIDYARQWIGTGELLSVYNLLPPSYVDQGCGIIEKSIKENKITNLNVRCFV